MSLQDIQREALSLMEQHGLLAAGWRFQWDTAVKRAGQCNYSFKTISLSRKIFSLPGHADEARDVILHEIAHALTPGAHHGPVWRRTARTIGCSSTRCHSLDVRPLANYLGSCRCKDGHDKWPRSKRPQGTYTCPKCRGQVTWRTTR